jgi:hypothetical protein
MAVTWRKLAYEDDVPLLTLFADAHYVLYSQAANVALGLAMGANTVLGRQDGNIIALSAANLRTIANVEDGADVTDADNVGAAGAVMETDFANAGDIPYASAANIVSMLGIGANGKVLTVTADLPAWEDPVDSVMINVANTTELYALDPVLGKMAFQVDELHPYICTVIA